MYEKREDETACNVDIIFLTPSHIIYIVCAVFVLLINNLRAFIIYVWIVFAYGWRNRATAEQVCIFSKNFFFRIEIRRSRPRLALKQKSKQFCILFREILIRSYRHV